MRATHVLTAVAVALANLTLPALAAGPAPDMSPSALDAAELGTGGYAEVITLAGPAPMPVRNTRPKCEIEVPQSSPQFRSRELIRARSECPRYR